MLVKKKKIIICVIIIIIVISIIALYLKFNNTNIPQSNISNSGEDINNNEEIIFEEELAKCQNDIDKLNKEIKILNSQISEQKNILKEYYILEYKNDMSNKENINYSEINEEGLNEEVEDVFIITQDYYDESKVDAKTREVFLNLKELEKRLEQKKKEENELAIKIGNLYSKYGN